MTQWMRESSKDRDSKEFKVNPKYKGKIPRELRDIDEILKATVLTFLIKLAVLVICLFVFVFGPPSCGELPGEVSNISSPQTA